MATDRQGNIVSGSAASAAALDRVIHDFYAWTGDILGDLAAATQADPDFALGHSATAIVLMLSGLCGDDVAVTAAFVAGETAARKATERERAHLGIARDLIMGEMRAAAARCEAILVDHPRDVLALRYATDLYYYLGESAAIRNVVARVLTAWDTTDPIHGFVLGRYAFGLEEASEIDAAERVGHQALAIHPEDVWATHSVAHVFETRGQPEPGIHFLESTRADWSKGKWLAIHIGWHLALFLIEIERGAEVLTKYDAFIRPRLKDNFILDLIDAASLLWRLEIAGVDVGDRWNDVAKIAAARVGEHVLAFNDLHVALGLAGAKDSAAMARLIGSIDRFLAEGRGDNQKVTAQVGKVLVAATAAFADGDWNRTVELLLPVRGRVLAIGGSHAQRDVIEETLLAAAIRAGNRQLASELAKKRAARRPTPRALRLVASLP